MNIARTIIIAGALAVVGYLGYSFFFTWQPEEDELVYENNYNSDQEGLLESDLNYLEGVEFDGSEESVIESEQAFDSQMTAQEEQETSFDAELDELEAMEF